MTCFDPDNDPEFRVGMLQHTLDSVLDHLHGAVNRGEWRYVRLLKLRTARHDLDNLIARVELHADAQGWLLSERRDASSQDHDNH